MRTPPVAKDQYGLFSRHQAKEALSSEGSLDRALLAGTLTRLANGIYTAQNVTDRREQHLSRARAEILAAPGDWHAARRTAAIVHGLPLLGFAPTAVQLTRDRTTTRVRSNSRHRHINALPQEERTLVDGLPVTTVARTVWDIARRESFRSAVVVTDAALRSGLDRAELVALTESHRGWPGVRRAKAVIAFADGRAESPLESLGRVTCREESLPLFEPQVEIWIDGERVARVDGLWRGRLVVFEGDGGVKFDACRPLGPLPMAASCLHDPPPERATASRHSAGCVDKRGGEAGVRRRGRTA